MKMLRKLGLAAFASLWGCGGGSAKDAGVSPDGGPPYTAVDAGREARPADSGEALGMFEAWEQARAALRQSPDHLPGKADALVKEGDPAKLFQFVRDDIMTYPPSDDSFVGCVTAQRWGVQGTLRGGAGTPREKAELLASLYRRARLTAELVVGQADPSKIDGKAVLLRSHQRRFAQPITADQATAWNRALGHDGGTKHTAIDPRRFGRPPTQIALPRCGRRGSCDPLAEDSNKAGPTTGSLNCAVNRGGHSAR